MRAIIVSRLGSRRTLWISLAWLLNSLHAALGGTRKPGSSVIHQALQGKVRILTRKASANADEEHDAAEEEVDEKESPFLYLTVDVPAAPLFKDALERNIILRCCCGRFSPNSTAARNRR